MKGDPGSNYLLDGADVSCTDTTASLVVDHANGPSCSFYLVTKSVGTSFNAKIQYSDDGSNYTDDDGTTGNSTAITAQTGADEDQLNVPNPRGRYSRLLCTAVGAVVSAAFSVTGPKRHIAAE